MFELICKANNILKETIIKLTQSKNKKQVWELVAINLIFSGMICFFYQYSIIFLCFGILSFLSTVLLQYCVCEKFRENVKKLDFVESLLTLDILLWIHGYLWFWLSFSFLYEALTVKPATHPYALKISALRPHFFTFWTSVSLSRFSSVNQNMNSRGGKDAKCVVSRFEYKMVERK